MGDAKHTPGPHIDIVFDGPPSHESGRFVEVENERGESINFGEWVERPDGYWVLRFRVADPDLLEELESAVRVLTPFETATQHWAGILRERLLAAIAKAKPAPAPVTP